MGRVQAESAGRSANKYDGRAQFTQIPGGGGSACAATCVTLVTGTNFAAVVVESQQVAQRTADEATRADIVTFLTLYKKNFLFETHTC